MTAMMEAPERGEEIWSWLVALLVVLERSMRARLKDDGRVVDRR